MSASVLHPWTPTTLPEAEGVPVAPTPPPSPNTVRELRRAKLWTQRQLAVRAKVALRTIHSIERGLPCRLDTKRKILDALGLTFGHARRVWPQ